MNRVPLWLLLLLSSSSLCAEPFEQPTAEQKKALLEMDAKIQQLKAEGKLPDKLPVDGPIPDGFSTAKAAAAKAAPEGCTRLRVGESAVVYFPNSEESPTGVGARYGLSRPRDDSFLVEVNLHFSPGSGYDGTYSPKDVNESYHARVDSCLKEFEGLLKNERAGRQLQLRITKNPAVPVQEISVVKSGTRANSIAYPSGISCPVILHEIMHVLGLADEYRDTPGLKAPFADCRVAGPGDSLMADEFETLTSLKPQTAYSVEMCRCETRGDACWALAEKNKGKACPPGTTSFLQGVDPALKTSLNVLNSSEAFVLNEIQVPSGQSPPAHLSALYPAHFRAITEPGCRDVNENYYSCVINSYRSTKTIVPGAEGAQIQGCLPKPEACKWGSHKWLE